MFHLPISTLNLMYWQPNQNHKTEVLFKLIYYKRWLLLKQSEGIEEWHVIYNKKDCISIYIKPFKPTKVSLDADPRDIKLIDEKCGNCRYDMAFEWNMALNTQ